MQGQGQGSQSDARLLARFTRAVPVAVAREESVNGDESQSVSTLVELVQSNILQYLTPIESYPRLGTTCKWLQKTCSLHLQSERPEGLLLTHCHHQDPAVNIIACFRQILLNGWNFSTYRLLGRAYCEGNDGLLRSLLQVGIDIGAAQGNDSLVIHCVELGRKRHLLDCEDDDDFDFALQNGPSTFCRCVQCQLQCAVRNKCNMRCPVHYDDQDTPTAFHERQTRKALTFFRLIQRGDLPWGLLEGVRFTFGMVIRRGDHTLLKAWLDLDRFCTQTGRQLANYVVPGMAMAPVLPIAGHFLDQAIADDVAEGEREMLDYMREDIQLVARNSGVEREILRARKVQEVTPSVWAALDSAAVTAPDRTQANVAESLVDYGGVMRLLIERESEIRASQCGLIRERVMAKISDRYTRPVRAGDLARMAPR